MKKALLIFLLCPLLAFAQKGWIVTKEANTVTYMPADLPLNKEFQCKFYRIDLNGIDKKTWIIQHARDQQFFLGETIKKWKIKSKKQGEWSTSSQYVAALGGKLSIGYETGTLADGKPYVLQFISSPDLVLLIKYRLKLRKLKNYAEKELMGMQVFSLATANTAKASNSEVTRKSAFETTQKGSFSASEFSKMSEKKYNQYVKKKIRTEPNQGVKLSAIETVFVDVKYNASRGRVTSYTYFLFKDGTVYGDCTVPIRDLNIKKSQKLEWAFSKWTFWKKQGDKYYFQNTKTGKWMLKNNPERALPGQKGLRLNNTYWMFSGDNMLGLQTPHKGYYRFMPNGRFEISSFTMSGGNMDTTDPYSGTISKSDKKGSDGTTGLSDGSFGGEVSAERDDGSKNTGTYYIDGYTIEFHHDNGWVHRELFHFPEEHDKKCIHINDEVYWIRSNKE